MEKIPLIYVPRGDIVAAGKPPEGLSELPGYIQRGIETSVRFIRGNCAEGRGYKGLLLLFGQEERLRRTVNRLDGGLTKRYREYNPVLFSEAVQKLYMEMAERDGGIAFDLEGNLLGTEVSVERVSDRGLKRIMDELMRIKGNGKEASERHRAGAYASKHGASTVIVSEERGTVIPILEGGILCPYYDPLSDPELVKEEDLYEHD
jgi:hypothetical protein